MKPNKNQMYFKGVAARPITRAPSISEPLVWFQNLYLMRRLGAGCSDETCIRSFKLRAGLNILWAEPEDPDASEGLYGDGFAGHATGKTLFCRILRHLLGEPNFGTAELQTHVRGEFRELWAVATVRLNGKTWVIGRLLTGSGEDFAIEDGNIESVFQAIPDFSGYDRFNDSVENECGGPLAKMYPAHGWRNLLPWLARDQEARFATIIAWRDSSSEADNPRTSAAAQHLILRAVLGLLHADEFDIREKIADNEESVKEWNLKLPLKQAVAFNDRAQVERTLKSVPFCKVDLADLDAARKSIISQKEIRQESIQILQAEPESQQVQDARKALQDVISDKAAADAQIQSLGREIPKLRKQADESLLTVQKIKKGGLRDPKRVADGFCPNSYQTAEKNGCVPKSLRDDDRSMVEIGDLEAQAKALKDAVGAKEDEKARLETQVDQLAGDVKERERTLSKMLRDFPNPAIAIERQITLLEKAEVEIEEAIKSAQEEKNMVSEISRAERRVSDFRDKLDELKSFADLNLQRFSDIFADVIRALLGAPITAFADLGDLRIRLHAKKTRELGGAAVDSVKTIAFDLASVLLSIEGHCSHPRFLIHDGPREADMARVIYERFFLYARRMEEAMPPDQIPFQYILTTTTHPPNDMREGSDWLLGEKLSGKTKAGRLLKEDF